ncbi:hypothetical protein TIFTF001_016378 [Ficus carica]|uniref:Phosphoribosylglycinamide formyltransferase, chloroplastic n=1 Tax=Ficus carica TaxID=3494 RepID=A0AA88D8Q2_FICCA|nr:hypothetical protein TIFTF001_016378 [Ficus carica]
MEVKSIVSGLCLSTTVPSIQTIKKPFFAIVPPHPSTISFVKPQIRVSYRSHPSISQRTSDRKKIRECRNAAVEAAGVDFSVDFGSGINQKKLAVFVSGGGSNFRSIHEASLTGSILGDVVVLVTNKRGCGGAEFAREKGIPVILFPKTKDEPDGVSPTDLVATLRGFEVDFVLLAGYLKLIPVELIRAYPKSIINIHPSLLPAFGGKGYYGLKVHKAVIASGARFSGPTIHFVDEHYDTGRILAQRVVPVLPQDTAEELAARVLREEHSLYVEVVAALCEDRIMWRQDGVPLIQTALALDLVFDHGLMLSSLNQICLPPTPSFSTRMTMRSRVFQSIQVYIEMLKGTNVSESRVVVPCESVDVAWISQGVVTPQLSRSCS